MKLEALSIYKQGDKLDAMTWFRAARVRLKNQASLGSLFSEEGAIAAIMDRADVGSTVATLYQAQTNTEDFIIYRVLRNDIFSRIAEIQG